MLGDKLVLVPNTADCFRVTVRLLRSGFHTYSLPVNRWIRLLINGPGKNMPEQEVREELEILEIPVQSVLQEAPLAAPRSRPCKGQVPHTVLRSVGSSRATCQHGARFDVSLWSQSESIRTRLPRDPNSAKPASASIIRNVIVVIPRGAWPVVAHTFRTESALFQRTSHL